MRNIIGKDKSSPKSLHLLLVRPEPRQTGAQVQAAVNKISEKKRTIESEELFLDLSAAAETLVLSNEDIHLLKQLKDHHRAAIRNLHIPLLYAPERQTRPENQALKKSGDTEPLILSTHLGGRLLFLERLSFAFAARSLPPLLQKDKWIFSECFGRAMPKH